MFTVATATESSFTVSVVLWIENVLLGYDVKLYLKIHNLAFKEAQINFNGSICVILHAKIINVVGIFVHFGGGGQPLHLIRGSFGPPDSAF